MIFALAVTIFYYVPTEGSWTSFEKHAGKIAVVAPQVFVVRKDGAVEGAVEQRVRTLARQKGIEIMPLLTNEDFSAAAAHAALASDTQRRRVVSDSVRLCQENGCAGLQLDFEGVAEEDASGYQALVRQLAVALHQAKLYLSVAVASPLFQGSRPLRDYRSTFGGFVLGDSFLDFKEIGQHADFVTLMTYDLYGRGAAPGPVAAYPWVEQCIRYFLQYVPAAKLSLGLPFYGRRWCWQDVKDLTFADVQDLLLRTKAKVRRQAWGRTPTFDFEQEGCHNVVFFEDRQSLLEKLRLVRQYRLPGFSAWRLGQEDPTFWSELPVVRRKRAPR